MEEWVGQQWDRFIRRAAHRQHDAAAVSLSEVQRTLALMFRAAGGAHAVRLSPASERRVGGARDWVQRMAGTGTHAATGRLEPEALSLPPSIAVHADPALNRSLYLWLAALAAHIEPSGDWIADNLAAQQRVLPLFPGLADRFERLLAAERALRPDPARLRGRAAEAERRVQQALAGRLEMGQGAAVGVQPDEVAPVWMWLDTTAAATTQPVARDQEPAEAGAPRPAAQDGRRRRAQAVVDERDKAPLMMFFRAESILSWGEFVKVNRASDDDEDGNALNAANDMDVLA
ncbi:MAG: nitric oxide reductase activation protein NorD, partial [Hydrogenophaga sp.]